jgi:hypothetical protein
MRQWTALTAEVAAQGDRRVLVSSAFFGDGDETVAAHVVEGLGGPQVHVVVTLRPLTKVMPSQWQQYVQNGLRMPYEEWLDGILNMPLGQAPTPTFWKRHRHDELVARWAGAAGAANVIAVVVDGSDLLMLLRTFEEMLGLPGGFLVLDHSAENRSLTFGEVELIRLINEEIKRREWPEEIYARFMKAGVLRQLKVGYQPGPDEPRASTPAWALKRAAEIDTEIARNISALGVRVVGDVSALYGPPAGTPQTGADTPMATPMVPPPAAAQAIIGAILGSKAPSRLTAEKVAKKQPARVEDRPVREVDAKELARVLIGRGKRRARSLLRGH